jgi:CARDB
MVRRRVAAGIGVALVIVIVLIVNGCLKSQKTQALKDYGHNVSRIVEEANQKVSKPLFAELTGASSKSALDVETQINQLHLESQQLASQAKGLSVPSEMEAPQRDLLLALDLQAEGVAKVANQVRTALGGQAKQASTLIAGDMENFLASDVINSQRVAPLIEQTLKGGGIEGQTVTASHFLPNIGWLEPSTVQARITGQGSGAGQNGQLAPGSHGSALVGVSVGANTLASEPTLNHISGGSAPTFTVTVENAGESTETNVKVDVTVTAQGKQLKATRSIDSIQAGSKVNVDIPVENVPAGASKIEVYVEPVPGETNTENNKGAYLAVFGS